MENQADSKNIILNYGLIFGTLLVISSLVVYALGIHMSETGGYINFAILAIALIVFPLLSISVFKKENNGFLKWSQGLKVGIGVVIIGVLISIIYQHIFTAFIEPDFYIQLEEIQRQGFMESGMTSEQIDNQIAMTSKFQGTLIGDALGLLFFIFIGFIISAIISAIKKHSEEDDY